MPPTALLIKALSPALSICKPSQTVEGRLGVSVSVSPSCKTFNIYEVVSVTANTSAVVDLAQLRVSSHVSFRASSSKGKAGMTFGI